jgi:hypothetical protein
MVLLALIFFLDRRPQVRVDAGNRMVSRKHETLQKVGNGLSLVHEAQVLDMRRGTVSGKLAGTTSSRPANPTELGLAGVAEQNSPRFY